MTLEEAKQLLDACQRGELQDHAFGDAEVEWTNSNGDEVASGYFGSTAVVGGDTPQPWEFKGEDAWALRKCGSLGGVERNDMTGPDRYSEGSCMPGLTIDGVRKELTE